MQRETWQIVLAAAIAGFIGAGTEHFATVRSVHAQELTHPKTLTTERLVLVDSSGQRRAVLSASPNSGALVLMDSGGRKRLELDGAGTIRIFNEQQRPVWIAPESMRMFPLSE